MGDEDLCEDLGHPEEDRTRIWDEDLGHPRDEDLGVRIWDTQG